MARTRGTGNLQQEKNGTWTLRVGWKGRRLSRSTGTTDRARAEKALAKFLAPLGGGERHLALADAWPEYIKSPNRRDQAPSTLNAKRNVYLTFARWMAAAHPEADSLRDVSHEAVAEYLADLRSRVCATTYNFRVCVLREIFICLAGRAGLERDPWDGVSLLVGDGHSRRELTVGELLRLLAAAARQGEEWKTLFVIGIYTGLRLGDCCCLKWRCVDLARRVIQIIPSKTCRHSHGQPVTIPIHDVLFAALAAVPESSRGEWVLERLSEWYRTSRGKISYGLVRIFRSAGISTSVRIEGRRRKTPEATFHSLRHTFVSLAANAGVPLPVVQAIVGHATSAMTRHYYHENEDALRRAVSALPSLGEEPTRTQSPFAPAAVPFASVPSAGISIEARLKRLQRLARQGLVTAAEFAELRRKMLAML